MDLPVTSHERASVSKRLVPSRDLSSEDPLVDKIQHLAQARAGEEPHRQQVVAGEELPRLTDPVDPAKVNKKLHRA